MLIGGSMRMVRTAAHPLLGPYPVEGNRAGAYFSVILQAADECGLQRDCQAFLDRVETRD